MVPMKERRCENRYEMCSFVFLKGDGIEELMRDGKVLHQFMGAKWNDVVLLL